MSEKPDPLKELWQQQPVDQPDVAALKRTWQQVRRKQYFYVSLDLLSVLAFPFLIVVAYDRFHIFELTWLIVLAVACTALAGYVVWLRRFALSQNSNLVDYTALLRSQYQQNIKIALLSQYMVFVFPPVFGTFFIGIYWLELYEPERFMRKLTFSLGWLAVFLPAIWFWARSRIKKFEQKLLLLN